MIPVRLRRAKDTMPSFLRGYMIKDVLCAVVVLFDILDFCGLVCGDDPVSSCVFCAIKPPISLFYDFFYRCDVAFEV